MTEYRSEIEAPEAAWRRIPDTAESIMRDLKQYTLDPTFELYGGFVNRFPEWIDAEHADKYIGCTIIGGNFLAYSHAFDVITDDRELIEWFAEAIKENQQREEYKQARTRALAKVPVLSEFSKKALTKPGKYMFYGMNPEGEIINVKRVYRITEEEANGHSLLFLDRWEGVNSEGILIGGAFYDGDTMKTTKGWAIYQQEGGNDERQG